LLWKNRNTDIERLNLGLGGGIGLGATRERLLRMYGEQQTLRLQSLPEGGTEVRITLPLHLAAHNTKSGYAERSSSDNAAATVIHGAGN
jgi:signal transduction histidine kinase